MWLDVASALIAKPKIDVGKKSIRSIYTCNYTWNFREDFLQSAM
jgi:hypothetical protein